ncbi:MAG: c-type cytochrome [Alphaproteobacteria bacterium]
MKRITVIAATGAFILAAPIAIAVSAGADDAPIRVTQADDAALLAALIAEGEDLYDTYCAGCHGDAGEGTAGPRLATGPAPDFVQSSVVKSAGSLAAQILSGNPDRGMPAFGGNLSDREVAAIGTFVRNSWGNDFGILPETSVATRR